jgi:FlaA1/EpsC-like NDP-sugar epimerase
MFSRFTRNRHFWITLFGDVCLVLAAYYCAHLIRFEGRVPHEHLTLFLQTAWWILVLKIVCFFWFDLYKGMWRFFSLYDLVNMVKACVLALTVTVITVLVVYRFKGFSRSVFLIDMLLCLFFIGGYRLAIRMALTDHHNGANRLMIRKHHPHLKKMVIVGAGNAGEILYREIRDNPSLAYDVVGFVDDDSQKIKSTLHGVPVLGALQDLGILVRQYQVDEITIAVPSASASQMRRIVGICKSSGVPFKTLPGLGELIDSRVTVSAVRDVRYEDLLGRAPVELDRARIGSYVTGKRVLVTGGAGSIGAELCRQIAGYRPAQLIIVERNESGLYELEFELQRLSPGLETVAALGTIQHNGTMARIFDRYRPQTVFHAAAYKHVPMMEHHPWEAVFNNVLGSEVVIRLCATKGVERCVVASTDKAVRPTNVMGASKRMVELIAQSYASTSPCRFMAVRFGNVLGSAGSVLPLFMAQIEAGGPVTVTDPQVTRYFMTIPEACSLILQAGAIGRGGEIFILKMGTPVKIDAMARDLITLSGFVPGKEIEIKYIGLRPGEKLYEELITEGEDVVPTRHEDIMVLKPSDGLPAAVIHRQVETLRDRALKRDEHGIKMALCEVVPEYRPQVKGRGPDGDDTVILFDDIRMKRLAN